MPYPRHQLTMKFTKAGFTLIEVLVVIAIISVILALSVPNYLGARERARDAKRKEEMYQLKTALRVYYNDFNVYPAAYTNMGAGRLNYIAGCGDAGTGQCPCSSSVDFASGTTCDTIYMKKFPGELGSTSNGMYYYLGAAGDDDFCLKKALENKSDPDITASQTRCASACGANCTGTTDYCVCAD